MSPQRAFPLAAIFVVAFLAGVPGDGGPPAAAAQDGSDDDGLQHYRGWSKDDFWVYEKVASATNPSNTEGTISFHVAGAVFVENTRFFNEERYPEEWRKHQTLQVDVHAKQFATSAHGPTMAETKQERYVRTTDLGNVQTHARTGYRFADNPEMNGGSERFHEYYPPHVEMVFPFKEGDKWRTATVVRNHNPNDGGDCGGEGRPPCNTTSQKVHTYSVVGHETMTMMLNGEPEDLQAWRIVVVDELGFKSAEELDKKKYEIWWWSPEVCNVVKKEEYDADGKREMVWTLQEYKCKGRDAPDPTYEIYGTEYVSSTRLHGSLGVPPALEQVERMRSEGDKGLGEGLIHLAERAPAPGAYLLLLTLAGAVAAARRPRT